MTISMFGFWNRKREVEEIKDETRKGFDHVKQDIQDVSKWVQHLKQREEEQQDQISEIKEILSSIRGELEDLRQEVSLVGSVAAVPKTGKNKQVFGKQMGVYPVQTAVFEQFSVTERTILWVLLNYEGKLSYEDIAVLLEKDKSTIRGQINMIRDKNEGIIEETVEKSGKKRVFIPDEIKEKVLKKTKVSAKRGIFGGKFKKNE